MFCRSGFYFEKNVWKNRGQQRFGTAPCGFPDLRPVLGKNHHVGAFHCRRPFRFLFHFLFYPTSNYCCLALQCSF